MSDSEVVVVTAGELVREYDYEKRVQLTTQLCEGIASGKSVVELTKAGGLPATQSFYNWFRKHPELRLMYEEAQEDAAERAVYEMKQLVDFVDETSAVAVAACRLKTDVRKWIAEKHYVRRYGAKQTVDLNATIKVDHESVLEAARRRCEQQQ